MASKAGKTISCIRGINYMHSRRSEVETKQSKRSYKQIHKLGKRKTNEKIVSYNESYPYYKSVIQKLIETQSSVCDRKTARAGSRKRSVASPDAEKMRGKRKSSRESLEGSPPKQAKVESASVPVFRLKREASLNAQARVNILFEKNPPPPKRRKCSDDVKEKANEMKVIKTPELQVKLTDLKNSPMKDLASSTVYKVNVSDHEHTKNSSPKKSPQASTDSQNLKKMKAKKERQVNSSTQNRLIKSKGKQDEQTKKPSKPRKSVGRPKMEITPKSENKKRQQDVPPAPQKRVFKELETVSEEKNLIVRRMASLNAAAIMAAHREFKPATERAARVDRYCVSWKHRETKGKSSSGAHWVDGTGSVCCSQFKEECPSKNLHELSPPAPQQGQSKHMLQQPSLDESSKMSCPLPQSSPPHWQEIHSEDRPSSVVDVVTAHPPSVSTPSSLPIAGHCLGPIRNGCLKPCTQYTCHGSSNPEEFVATSQFHTYTLGGIGSLSSLQMMSYSQPYRSAFSVPYNLAMAPYGYYSMNEYYQPTPGPILQRGLHAEPCLLRHIPMQVPHAQVKVLIHNPDTPLNCSAFSPSQDMLHLHGDRKPPILASAVHGQGSWNSGESGKTGRPSGGEDTKSRASGKKSEDKGNGDGNKSKNGEKKTDRDGQKNKNGVKKADASKPKQQQLLQQKKGDVRKPKQADERDKKGGPNEKKPPKKVSIPETIKPSRSWFWEGEPVLKRVPKAGEDTLVERMCYPAVRHRDGDVVRPFDCVLLMSTSRKDKPYVAKVMALWEDPTEGEMMMSLMWYYRPEHTEAGPKPDQLDDELFACRHVDENPVACIDDIAYVLTFSEYCRYKGEQCRDESFGCPRRPIVPVMEEEYFRQDKLPPMDANPATVFFSRYIYNLKSKKIIKPASKKKDKYRDKSYGMNMKMKSKG